MSSARAPIGMQGPVQLLSYREGYPDPQAPDSDAEQHPYVDLAVRDPLPAVVHAAHAG